MERAVEARRREDDLVRPLDGVFGEFLQCLVGRAVVDDQHAGVGDETRDRNEVVPGKLGLAAEQFIDLREAGDRHDMQEQRVAVGLRTGGDLGADGAGRACLGVDDRRLPDDRLQHGGKRASDHIGGAARRKRIDECDGAGGIGGGVLRMAGRGHNTRCGDQCRRGGGRRAADEAASVHRFLPDFRFGSAPFVIGMEAVLHRQTPLVAPGWILCAGIAAPRRTPRRTQGISKPKGLPRMRFASWLRAWDGGLRVLLIRLYAQLTPAAPRPSVPARGQRPQWPRN